MELIDELLLRQGESGIHHVEADPQLLGRLAELGETSLQLLELELEGCQGQLVDLLLERGEKVVHEFLPRQGEGGTDYVKAGPQLLGRPAELGEFQIQLPELAH